MSKYYISDTELYHWKYVKRERKNGRWVYYYDNDSYNSVKSSMKYFSKRYEDATKQKNSATANRKTAEKKWLDNPSDESLRKLGDRRLAELKADQRYIQEGKNFVSTQEKFKEISIKTLPQRTVVKGLNAVSKLLSKVKKLTRKTDKQTKQTITTASQTKQAKKTTRDLRNLKSKLESRR